MKKQSFLSIVHRVLLASLVLLAACSKNDSSTSADKVALSLSSTGATIQVGGTYALNYAYIKADGSGASISSAVSWTSSNSAVASVSSTGVVTGVSAGATFIKASANVNGKTITATVPIQVTEKSTQGKDPGQSGLSDFIVAPGSILWSDLDLNSTLQMEYVFFGSGTLSAPSYTSSNSAVATVSSSGLVTFKGAGECVITVTASANGKNYTQYVPVLVIGLPDISPNNVVRIELTPTVKKLFIGGTTTYTAKAYNASGTEVTGVPFTWDIEDAEPDTVNGVVEKAATVNQSGTVTAVHPNVVKVTASAYGIKASATVMVYPDGYFDINPPLFSVSAGQSSSLTAQYYEFDNNFNAINKPVPANTEWKTLFDLFPIPGIPKPGTLSASGASATYTADMSAMGQVDVVFIYNNNPRVAEGASAVTINF